MPRSSYVYVVQDVRGTVIAGFTVKHELIAWLRNQSFARNATVTRVPDRPRVVDERHPHVYDVDDLIRGA